MKLHIQKVGRWNWWWVFESVEVGSQKNLIVLQLGKQTIPIIFRGKK